MFFILSKVLNFLTNPLVMVLILMTISFFLKRAKLKKIFFWTGFGLLIFFSNEFIANEVMLAWEPAPTPYHEIKKTYAWGIVLTGVTHNDREPSDRVYFHHGADRVTHAVELYKKGIIKKILISGGSGRLMSSERKEANEIFRAMILMGVPEQDMVIENQSRNTHESAVMVKEMLKGETEGCLLITSAFHMYRSKACFVKAGFSTIDTFTTDFYTHRRYFTPDVLFIPKPESIMIWQKIFKEWTGIIAYKVAGYI
jgi:uncharacterized SAM-binding protein YcdF (DUF218 family)